MGAAGGALRLAIHLDSARSWQPPGRLTEGTAAGPTLLLVVAADCPCCESALADLHVAFEPERHAVRTVIVERGEPGSELPAIRPPLVPCYLLYDEEGRFRAARFGYRPAEELDAWLATSLADASARNP
jgi:hypothetical protein